MDEQTRERFIRLELQMQELKKKLRSTTDRLEWHVNKEDTVAGRMEKAEAERKQRDIEYMQRLVSGEIPGPETDGDHDPPVRRRRLTHRRRFTEEEEG